MRRSPVPSGHAVHHLAASPLLNSLPQIPLAHFSDRPTLTPDPVNLRQIPLPYFSMLNLLLFTCYTAFALAFTTLNRYGSAPLLLLIIVTTTGAIARADAAWARRDIYENSYAAIIMMRYCVCKRCNLRVYTITYNV